MIPVPVVLLHHLSLPLLLFILLWRVEYLIDVPLLLLDDRLLIEMSGRHVRLLLLDWGFLLVGLLLLTLQFLLLKLPLPLLADLGRLSKDKLLKLLLLSKHLLALFLDHALLVQLLLLHLLDDLEILLFEVLILLLLLVEIIQVFHVGFLLGAAITP